MTKQEENKIYYLQNRKQILEKKKLKYSENKEYFKMKNKQYYEKNKTQIRTKQNEYQNKKAFETIEEVIDNAKSLKTKFKYLGDYLKWLR